jgi:NTE family protein
MGDRCFYIFEGGGARGIAHVGALAAIESSGFTPCGFAGTSAGAIIAALAAAGYRSDEMVNERGTILELIDTDGSNIWGGDAWRPAKSPRDLFGGPGWFFIRAAQFFTRMSSSIRLYMPHTVLLIVVLFWYLATLDIPLQLIVLLAVSFALLGAGYLTLAYLSRGLASLAIFERSLNQLLKQRIAIRWQLERERRQRERAEAEARGCPQPDEPQRPPFHHMRGSDSVTFADMRDAKCPPLRIVAADISSQQLELFSVETHPDTGVASAVAASICLPVIFKPWKIKDRLYLDGGLVSNLPAWTFDRERAIDRDAWTAVVQVGEPATPKMVDGPGILKAAVMTGIFGSGLLNVRNVDRLKAVALEVDLTLLDFNPGLERANKVVEAAKTETLQRLVFQLRDVPAIMNPLCERIAEQADSLINLAISQIKGRAFKGRTRVSIFVKPDDDASSLTAEYQYGFRDAPDERIRLPIDSSIVGQALLQKKPIYLERRLPDWHCYLAKEEHRWLQKQVCPRMNWVYSVPFVPEKDGMELVVSIDSDTYIPLDDALRAVTLDALAETVRVMLDEFVPKRAFSNDFKKANQRR